MGTIILPQRCDRAAAEALLPELVALTGTSRIAIDGTGVTQVGQAMLQLLISARHSITQVTISSSQALRDAASLAGLSSVLFDEARP